MQWNFSNVGMTVMLQKPYIILYCTLQYCTIIYCILLHRTILQYTVLYCNILYTTTVHCIILQYNTLYYTTPQNTIPYMQPMFVISFRQAKLHKLGRPRPNSKGRRAIGRRRRRSCTNCTKHLRTVTEITDDVQKGKFVPVFNYVPRHSDIRGRRHATSLIRWELPASRCRCFTQDPENIGQEVGSVPERFQLLWSSETHLNVA